ncbi:MAG: hypothetical protein ACLFV0_06600, partial [Nitriliruptoraceae bacterium]
VAGGVGGSVEPPPPGSYEPVWGTRDGTGEACVDLVYRPEVPPNSTVAIEWDLRTIEMTNDPLISDPSDAMCDPDLVQPTPTAAVIDFVRRIPLPEPLLSVDPGFALTGLPAYLTINGQEGFEVQEALPGWGTLQVDLRPTEFAVDWGDGAIETVTDGRTGGAHDADPTEHITHVYRWSDPQGQVAVRSTWEARWSVGDFSGTVADLVIDAALDVPVREYRTVRAGT